MIEDLGINTLLKYTFETIKACPMSSLRAFFNVTSMVWDISGDLYWDITDDSANRFDASSRYISEDMQTACRSVVDNWHRTVRSSIWKNVFYYVGTLDLLIIVCCLVRVKRWSDMLKAVHALPMLCYNFGTALLLTGFDYRFFYYAYPVFLPFIFLILRRENKETN